MNTDNDHDWGKDLARNDAREAWEYADLVTERINNPADERGFVMPWSNMQDAFRIRADEYTLLHGYSGSRKSLVIGQMTLAITQQRGRVHIITLEMSQDAFLERLVKQAAGNSHPSDKYRARFFERLTGKFNICAHSGPQSQYYIQAYIDSQIEQHGQGQVFIIDPFGYVDTTSSNDDDSGTVWQGQGWFASWLAMTAHESKCGIILVHHARKSAAQNADEKIPSASDASGSGNIINFADNVIAVWANKVRHRALSKTTSRKPLTKAEQKEIDEGFDQVLQVQKQRHVDWSGNINLFWHPQSLQLTEREGHSQGFIDL